MRKLFTILLITIGFILSPVVSHGAEVNIKKKCCSKEMSSTPSKKKCCKDKKSNKNSHDNCDGKCKSACFSAGANTALITFPNTELNTPIFSFLTTEHNFYTTESFVPSDFRAIWLPPKIG